MRKEFHRLDVYKRQHDELVAAAFPRGVNDLRIGRTLSAHADIVHDRKVKEVVVLRHIGDVLRALRQRQRANVHAAQVDFSVLHILSLIHISWDSRLQVTSRGYMLGYNDLKDPSVSGFFRFLARVGDGMMKMQIVKIGFGGKQ